MTRELLIFALGIVVGIAWAHYAAACRRRRLTAQYIEDTAIEYRAGHVRDVEAQAVVGARRLRSRKRRVSWLRLVGGKAS